MAFIKKKKGLFVLYICAMHSLCWDEQSLHICYHSKMCIFFQFGTGMLANAFLIVFHIFIFHQVHRPRPTDIITCHLAFVHTVKLLTTLDILSEDLFQLLNFPNELKCKLVFYMSRATRGVPSPLLAS